MSSRFPRRFGTLRLDGPRGPVEVSHILLDDLIRIAIRENRSIRRMIGIRFAAPARLSAHDVTPSGEWRPLLCPVHWPVGSRAGWGGVFPMLAAHLVRSLGEGRSVALRRSASAVRLHLRALAREAHARLDPAALRIARAFRPEARYWIYAAVLGDPTGRVGQLARTCPGVLLLALACETAPERRDSWGPGDVWRFVRAAAIRGAPLRALLRGAIEWWGSLPPCRGDARERLLENATDQERAALLERQRLLVRRAGPLVRPRDIAHAGLPAFAPEDIPRDPVRNAAWFRLSAIASHGLACVPDTEVVHRLARFFSRHALLVTSFADRVRVGSALPGSDGRIHELAEHVAGFSLLTGRLPALSGDPFSFLKAAGRWRWIDVEELTRLLGRLAALDLGEVTSIRTFGEDIPLWDRDRRPFPAPPSGPRVPRLRTEPLLSPVALLREGAEQRNCAPSLLGEAVAGTLFLFSVRHGRERLTLSVSRRRSGAGFELDELRGPENGEPSPATSALVRRWVAGLH